MIITFYSYKGGVGRSMALANVARWLYDHGLRVIVVDWDLEAPGLENYFADKPGASKIREAPGLLEILLGYMAQWSSIPWPPKTVRAVEPAMTPVAVMAGADAPVPAYAPFADAEADVDAEDDPLTLKRKVQTLHEWMPSPAYSLQPLYDSGRIDASQTTRGLWILTAGRRDDIKFADYADAVQMFDWSGLYRHYDGSSFFEWLRASLDGLADLVLVDSRTGVTEMGGVCTRHIADMVVCMCAPNESNVAGTERAIGLMRALPKELRGGRELEVIPVASRVDELAETRLLVEWRDMFLQRMNKAVGAQVAHLWDLRIPYVAAYSFTETLIVGEARGNELLRSRYEALAGYLAKRFATYIAPERRRQLLARIDPSATEIRELFVSPESDGEALWNEPGRDESQTALLKRFLLRLVRVGKSGEGTDTTAPVALSSLPAPERELAGRAGGLVLLRDVQGVASVELSFKDIAAWPRLGDWVAQDREFLLQRQHLDALMTTWRDSGRDNGALLGGTALLLYESLFEQRPADFLEPHREFLLASRAYEKTQDQILRKASDLEIKASSYEQRLKWGRVSQVGWVLVLIAALTYGYFREKRSPAPAPTPVAAVESGVDLQVTRAEEVLSTGRADLALSLGADIVKAAPQDPRGYFVRGRALSLMDDRDGANADFDKAIALGGGSDVYIEASRNLIQVPSVDRALSLLTSGLAKYSKDSTLWLMYGQLLQGTGKSAEARRAFDQAIANGPKNAVAYYERGKLLADGKGPLDLQLGKSDLETAAKIGDTNTQQAAIAILKRFGDSTPRPNPPRVFVHYNKDDAPALARAAAQLIGKSDFTVASVEARPDRTQGEVRYYFPEDATAALAVAALAESALAQQGERLKLRLRAIEGGAAPGARQGLVEVWLPPQRSTQAGGRSLP